MREREARHLLYICVAIFMHHFITFPHLEIQKCTLIKMLFQRVRVPFCPGKRSCEITAGE